MPAPEGSAVFPRWTEEQLTVPRLSHNGEIIEGWCKPPASGVWTPSELLWSPETATKASDFDAIAEIVDVDDGLSDLAWIQAQIDRRARYVDRIRDMVRAGKYRLTAGMAKLLGWDDDEAELVPRTGTGTIAYGKTLATAKTIDPDALALAKTLRDTAYALGAGPRIDPDTGLPILPGRA